MLRASRHSTAISSIARGQRGVPVIGRYACLNTPALNLTLGRAFIVWPLHPAASCGNEGRSKGNRAVLFFAETKSTVSAFVIWPLLHWGAASPWAVPFRCGQPSFWNKLAWPLPARSGDHL